jgi:hypothetical protein
VTTIPLAPVVTFLRKRGALSVLEGAPVLGPARDPFFCSALTGASLVELAGPSELRGSHLYLGTSDVCPAAEGWASRVLAFPQLFRIASFPRVRKEDLYYLRVNAVEYAQDETRQAIQKQEDARLVLLLEQAIVNLGSVRAGGITPGSAPTGGRAVGNAAGPASAPSEQTVLVGAGNALEPADFYNAVTQVEINQLEARRVLAHPADIRDLYNWDLNVTGFRFKDEVFAGGRITSFGEFQIQRSIIVPQGEVFLTAEPEFVGVFPVMYSLDVEENHQVEQFYKGWVLDELVGMLVLNPRGISRILKADSTAAPTKLDITGLA